MIDWKLYPNFTEAEFRCRHCGRQEMKPELLGRLQALRDVYGRPLPVTSGWRCADHPVEKAKAHPGMHSTGLAVDLGVQGAEAHDWCQAPEQFEAKRELPQRCEQVIDELRQPLDVLMRDRHQPRGAVRQVARSTPEQQSERSGDRGERSSQFMADGGDEFVLQPLHRR